MTDQSGQGMTFRSLGELRAAAIDAHQKGDLPMARNLYRLFLSRAPRDPAIWSNLGALFRADKNYEMAEAAQRRALALDPESGTVLNNAANAFYDVGLVEEALALRRRALAKEPGKPDNWATLGKYLRALGRHAEAEAELDKALKAHPDDAELHIQLSFALLSQGNYPQGFEKFNWRWQGDEITPPDLPFPQWKGEDLTGKAILVTPEQGFGDTVLMARFLEGLKALGAEVRMICKQPLRRVFSRLGSVDRFVEQTHEIEECVYWTPMMDLPRYLGTTLDTVPPPVDLFIPDDSVQRARAITAPFDGMLKVGVLWSGSVTYRANHKRSFSHRKFLQLANIPGVQLFSLYKGTLADAFHEDGTSCVIVDAASNDRDFADSAALICELDLVITMDSAIAHVSGSLGGPVWNLLHSEAYWLYEPFEDHTPWYPSMRLIRQPGSGDWGSVFSLLEDEVRELAREKATA